LVDTASIARMNLLGTETFSNTFGPKAQRKKPKLKCASLDEVAKGVDLSIGNY
jgi:nuclear GTP-binding protein